MIKKLFRVVTLQSRYIYGRIERLDGSVRNPARLDKDSGRVQFILWKG